MPNIQRLRLKLSGLAVLVFLVTFNISAQEDWNIVKEKAGIKVYTKTEPGSEYKAFKAEMQVSCKIENILEVLKNMKSLNNWVVNCKGVELLKTEVNDQFYYIETSLPWPFINRDMVYHFQYIQIDSQQVRVIVTGIPEYIQVREGIVRMVKTDGYWLLTSKSLGHTDVTYQMHVEPGGLIPAWLANTFIENVPFSTFKELRNIVQK
jgi:carbon monoxide dehydrogenase subunit G